jgi:hypothetical protein
VSTKPKRTLAQQLTYRLPAPEGPGTREFKRYLTPQLIPSEYVAATGAANHYVNLAIMLQAAQGRT